MLQAEESFSGQHPSQRERRIDMAAKMPHSGHDKHMCYLVNMRTNISDLKKLAKDAKFMCRNCARVANNKKNLCNPVKL
jgi:hypothetical protein